MRSSKELGHRAELFTAEKAAPRGLQPNAMAERTREGRTIEHGHLGVSRECDDQVPRRQRRVPPSVSATKAQLPTPTYGNVKSRPHERKRDGRLASQPGVRKPVLMPFTARVVTGDK